MLRRLGDQDVRSSSFWVMLDEMILRPDVLTRQRYVERWAEFYNGEPDYVRLGEKEFSALAGTRARRVPVRVLRRYRQDLIYDLERVKTFVNQHVAHRDRVAVDPITWSDLSQAIATLEQHLNSVGRMVTGDYLMAKATIVDDWRNVFRSGLFDTPSPRRSRRHVSRRPASGQPDA